MNRTEFLEMLKDVYRDIDEYGGNFQAEFGHDKEMLEQAKFAAAAALMAVDRYYTKLTQYHEKFDIDEMMKNESKDK